MNDKNLWSFRKFRRLLFSTLTNDVAQSMAFIVVPLIVLANGSEPEIAGIVTAIVTGAGIISQFFSGYIADHANPSVLIRFSSFVPMMAWLVLAVVQFVGVNNAIVTCFLATIAAIFSSLTVPSEHTIIQYILPENLYAKANSVTQGREAAANLSGSPLAGLLFGISSVLTLAVQSVFHLISAWVVPPVDMNRKHDSDDRDDLESLRIGFVFVWNDVPLRALVMTATIINLPFGMLPIVMIGTYEKMNMPPFLIGLYMSMMGIGIFLGSFFADKIMEKTKPIITASLAIIILSVSIFITALIYGNYILSCIVFLFAGLMLPSINSFIATYTMIVTPSKLIGRVVAATGVPGLALMPVGSYLGGVLLGQFGTAVSLFVATFAAFISIAPLWVFKGMRTLPILDSIKQDDLNG